MMDKILEKMFEEYKDFNSYMDMYSECTDERKRNQFKQIAEQEMHHYKMLYDLAFENKEKMSTDLEKSFYKHTTDMYKEMESRLR